MIIIHIPHSSVIIPNKYREQFILANDELENEAHIMADLFVDKLVENLKEEKVIFPFSRIVCDVERFRDDEKEEMAGRGMGVVYTKCHDLSPLRRKGIDPEKIKSDLYDKHHALFKRKVNEALQNSGICFILDVHSYADKPLPYELHKEDRRPDICLGFDEFHMEKSLIKKIKSICRKAGYDTSENEPFKGSIVPVSIYRKDKRVKSLMIEINKRTYLKDFEIVPEKFKKLKLLISAIVKEIRAFYQ
jgi:N-formylglutamate amidohydrolase